jgi:hypothetical protein
VRNRLEIQVLTAWRSQPYGQAGRCSACGRLRDENDRGLYVRGTKRDALRCLECFDLDRKPRKEDT